ncbi:MAG: YhcH/YjgK/YiaL family protein [Muribaculaceae bacterium]|nr:YhcH/YjgK/YiaL family protein [Muribaculaceae bacterium]
MILAAIPDLATYVGTSPEALRFAIEWLMAHASDPFVKGETIIQSPAGPITVKCEEPPMMPRERVALEAHQRFIDIHVPLKGVEGIGWAPLRTLKHPHGPYDPGRDIQFFGDSAHSILHVHPGQAAIFFPHDAHAPNIGLGNHRKLCIKIPC